MPLSINIDMVYTNNVYTSQQNKKISSKKILNHKPKIYHKHGLNTYLMKFVNYLHTFDVPPNHRQHWSNVVSNIHPWATLIGIQLVESSHAMSLVLCHEAYV